MGIKTGETVYTVLRHVSSSGMFRIIDAFVMRNGRPVHVFAAASDSQRRKLQDGKKFYKYDRDKQGFRMSGAGMDMGFELVYSMGRCIIPKFMCTRKPTCPSNDHSNGDMNYSPHTHSDSGYALKQRWL